MALVAIGVIVRSARGGSLEPTMAPYPTMHTIEEVYNATMFGGGPILGSEDRSALSMQIPGADFQGSYTIGSDANVMKLVSFSCGISASKATGGSGRDVNSLPITVVMNSDKCSWRLFKACITGELLDTVTIKYYGHATDSFPYLMITLGNAEVIQCTSGMVAKGSDKSAHLDTVSFNYATITWWRDSQNQFQWTKQ